MSLSATILISIGENSLARYLQEIRRFPMLEPQEEYMLAKRWREHGDRDAAHRLVTSHLRLVAKIAMGYRGYGLPISEVISEGNVGLMQAVKRFEPEKGFRLATYAMWWIKASIQEYILRSWSLVKMGTTANQKKLFFNLRKAKSKIPALEEGDLRPDQVKEIAKRLGVTEQDVVDMNRRLGGDVSLNAPIREDGEGEWQDWLVDETPARRRGSPRARSSTSAARRWRGARHAQRPRAADLRGAPAGGRADHARGAGRGIRRVARAHPPDRGARLREGAEGGEEPGGGDGNADCLAWIILADAVRGVATLNAVNLPGSITLQFRWIEWGYSRSSPCGSRQNSDRPHANFISPTLDPFAHPYHLHDAASREDLCMLRRMVIYFIIVGAGSHSRRRRAHANAGTSTPRRFACAVQRAVRRAVHAVLQRVQARPLYSRDR